ncbi:MAG: hypothetical protein V1816_10205 [Pseudomonadota bacterium]
MSTALTWHGFNTRSIEAEEPDVFRSKNCKLFYLLSSLTQGLMNSSKLPLQLSHEKNLNTSDVYFEQAPKVIESYKRENTVHMLNINSVFVKEYTPQISLEIFQSFIDIGTQMFKDARPKTEYEAKIVKNFVSSKAKTIFSRPI